MYCKKCGKLLKDNDVFCGNCGFKIENISTELKNSNNDFKNNYDNFVSANVNTKNNQLNKSGLSIVFILLILLILGYFVFSFNKTKLNNNDLEKVESNNKVEQQGTYNNPKKYSIIGYMEYSIPDCWVYDDYLTNQTQYKDPVFVFKDNISKLSVQASTVMDYNNYEIGTSYEALKNQVINTYGGIQEESSKYYNGVKWYIIKSNSYSHSNHNYYSLIYFALSKSSNHLYYFETYIDNSLDDKNKKYIEGSVDYIVNSAVLKKVDE